MQALTNEAWQTVAELAQRYGISTDAVTTMLDAVARGNGTMAQFYQPELGGGGQWMMGGMTMVGDMFNHGLKAKVDGLCNDLSQLLSRLPFVALPHNSQTGWQSGGSGAWWPAELGSPNSSGGQNNMRYAYFAQPRRLVIEEQGCVTVYDTLNHQISGVQQQQGMNGSLTMTSQYGLVDVASLPVITINGVAPSPAAAPMNGNSHFPQTTGNANPREADIFATIERLADLQQKGVLSQEEFATKKSELLSRL